MQSLYDDAFDALDDHTFTIPNVNIRKPYDESPKNHPYIVLTEIVNRPLSHGTVNGETRTVLGLQADIYTQNCVDDEDTVLSAFDAGRRLVGEVSDLLDTTFKLTRHYAGLGDPPAPDVVRHIYRAGTVLDSSGYTFRP